VMAVTAHLSVCHSPDIPHDEQKLDVEALMP
jgi:hypothetical protein